MLKTLAAQIKEYKRDSILTPVFMLLEVIMETIIPLMMASIIDDGVNRGNMKHIYLTGTGMTIVALWAESTEQGLLPDLLRICGRRCMKISRHFLFQTLTDTVRRDW